jgi:hypothetical protein
MILLDQDLHVLYDGVLEGRRTFGNVMKYIMMLNWSFRLLLIYLASLRLPLLLMTSSRPPDRTRSTRQRSHQRATARIGLGVMPHRPRQCSSLVFTPSRTPVPELFTNQHRTRASR